jgi:hypothetical protein
MAQCGEDIAYGWDWGTVQTGQEIDWYDLTLCLTPM